MQQLYHLEKLEEKLLILCNPNGDELSIIFNHKNLKGTLNFNDIHTLNFDVNNTKENGEYVEYYDLLTKGRIIKYQDIGEFEITNISEDTNGEYRTKSVTCKSIDFSLSRKIISILPEGLYKLEDISNTEFSIVHIILSYLPTWTLGTVDVELNTVQRYFNTSNVNLYNFLKEDVQTAFNCVVLFDTLEHKIYFKTAESAVTQEEIFFGFDNVVQNFKISEMSDELFTALNVKGGNDLSINLVNPLGTSVIYNLDSYIDMVDEKTGIRMMTQSLSDKWKQWKTDYATQSEGYSTRLETLKTYREEQLTLENTLTELDTDIKTANTLIATLTDLEEDTERENVVDSLEEKQTAYKETETAIENKKLQIVGLLGELAQINTTLQLQNYFTLDELKELDRFIIVGDFTDDNYTTTDAMTYKENIEMAEQLMDKAIKQLNIVSKLRYTFDIDSFNLFRVLEYKPIYSLLRLGSQITLEVEKGVYCYPILLQVSFDLDNLEKITFTFSEAMRLMDSEFQLQELLGQTVSTSTTVAVNNIKWNSYLNSGAKDIVTSWRKDGLNADIQKIYNADNQNVIMDDTGLRGRKLNPDTGLYEDDQWWFLNNELLFTDDSWKHAKMGIGKITQPNGGTGYGINAEIVMGQLLIGGQLHIANESGSFSVDGDTVTVDGLQLLVKTTTEGSTTQTKSLRQTIDDIGVDINDLDTTLTNKINGVDSTLTGEINSTNDNLDTLKGRVDGVLTTDNFLDTEKLNGSIDSTMNNMLSANGYMLFDGTGLWSMNTTDKATATNVVWINENGILLANHRDDGTLDFTTAIDANGINANLLQAGVINGSVLSSGKLFGGQIALGGTLTGTTVSDMAMANPVFSVSPSGVVNISKGQINLGNGNLILNDDGSFESKGSFNLTGDVNISGNTTIGGNLTMAGNITWLNGTSSPVQYQYSTDNANWHDTQQDGDIYRRENWNGLGWGTGYQFVGINGADGADGADGEDAHLPSYIELKGIDFTNISGNYINSPTINSGEIHSADIYGGIYYDLQKKSRFVLNPNDSTSNVADFIIYSGNNEAFEIYDEIAGTIDLLAYETKFLATGSNGTYAYGDWNFKYADVSGISTTATFG